MSFGIFRPCFLLLNTLLPFPLPQPAHFPLYTFLSSSLSESGPVVSGPLSSLIDTLHHNTHHAHYGYVDHRGSLFFRSAFRHCTHTHHSIITNGSAATSWFTPPTHQ